MENLGVFWTYYLAFGIVYVLYRFTNLYWTTNTPLAEPTPIEIFYMIILWPLYLLGFDGKDFS